jgi:hypothetical protein
MSTATVSSKLKKLLENEVAKLGERIRMAWRKKADDYSEAALRSTSHQDFYLRAMRDALTQSERVERDFAKLAAELVADGGTISDVRREAKEQIDALRPKVVETTPTAAEHIGRLRTQIFRFINPVAGIKDAAAFAGCRQLISEHRVDERELQRLLDECRAASSRMTEFISLIESELDRIEPAQEQQLRLTEMQ